MQEHDFSAITPDFCRLGHNQAVYLIHETTEYIPQLPYPPYSKEAPKEEAVIRVVILKNPTISLTEQSDFVKVTVLLEHMLVMKFKQDSLKT